MFSKRICDMLDNGWEVYDFCYESTDEAVKSAKAKGFAEVKAIRTRTDTKGLPMFVVLVKKES